MISKKYSFLKEVIFIIEDDNLTKLLYGVLQNLNYAVIQESNWNLKLLNNLSKGKNFNNQVLMIDYPMLKKFNTLTQYNNLICIYPFNFSDHIEIKGINITTKELTIQNIKTILDNMTA